MRKHILNFCVEDNSPTWFRVEKYKGIIIWISVWYFGERPRVKPDTIVEFKLVNIIYPVLNKEILRA